MDSSKFEEIIIKDNQMKILSSFSNAIRKSNLISQIENSKRKLIKSSTEEAIKYELELIALRQQMRLIDN